MTNEELIFAGALAKGTASERAAYLDEACGSQIKLRRAVEALLGAHDHAGTFLQSPPRALLGTSNGSTPTVDSSEAAGSVIGRYKLLECIGEGGMGAVYMAEQTQPVQRKVAVKIIKPGLDTRQVIARFEAERQALAMMDHPNIAKVLDAGTTDAGRPYFVMELVRGIPITDYCDQNQLTSRQRLGLFLQVCQAVQHAHTKGIIHRDLKPGNVLVTLQDGDKPTPKVIDFGIAKATTGTRLTDRTLFTEFRQLVGTPLYMSPEQAEMSAVMDVDTRSDVYSLGVLLYELLTGTTPFDRERLAKAAHDEVRRIIREEEPPRPSMRLSSLGATLVTISQQRQTDPKRLSALVRGELDWIVMKALEKERSRRYETADGLARDVERYLEDQPVEACPPSRMYRLRKFARRNRLALTAVAAIVSVLVLATPVSAWLAVRAMRAERQVVRERDQVAQEKRRADEQARIAKAINTFLDEDMLSQASAYGQATSSAASQPSPDLMVRDALDRAASRIGDRFKGQPLVESAVRRAIGTAYLHMGRYDAAEPQLEAAVQLARSAAGPLHPQALQSLNSQALLLFEQGRYADAEPRWREAIEGFRQTQVEETSDAISAMSNLGLLYQKQGRLDDSEHTLLRALELGRKSLGEDDPNVIAIKGNLADLYRVREEFPKAEQMYLAVFDASRRVRGEKHPDTVICMFNLTVTYLQQDKLEQAEAIAKQIQEINLDTLGPQHPDSLRAMQLLATIYLRQHRNQLAAPLLLRALEGERKVLGERHISTLNTMHDLARLYWAQGQRDRALELMDQAYNGKRSALGEDHLSTLSSLRMLAIMNHEQKRYKVAEPLYRQALAVAIKRRGERHPETIEVRRRLGNLHYEQRRFADAEPLFAQLDTLSDKELDLDPAARAVLLARYGLCLFHLGKLDRGETRLNDAFRRLTFMPQNDPVTHDVAAALAQICETSGRAEEAAAWRSKLSKLAIPTTSAPAPTTARGPDSLRPSSPRPTTFRTD